MLRSPCPLVPVCICVLACSTATAAPLRSGPVRIADDGKVSVSGNTVGTVPLPPGPRALSHRFVTVQNRRLLHLRVDGKGGRRGEMVLTPPPQGRVIFSGSTGPQGVDGEWSRHLQLHRDRILTFQRRQGIERCDGQPLYLFPRMYDFGAGRFRPVAQVPPKLENAPTLTARRDAAGMPTTPPINTFRLVAATTELGDGGEAQGLAAPFRAEDGKPETCWAEGLGGAGLGELLTARSKPSPYRLRAISIIPGDAASRRAFRRANRLKSFQLLLSPTQAYRVRFPTDPVQGDPVTPYWIVLPAPVATTCVTLVIDSIYPGTMARAGKSQGRTAIAELRFFTDLELGGGLEQVTRDLGGASAQRAEAAVGILSRLGGDGVKAVQKVLEATKVRPEVPDRALRVLGRIGHPSAAAPLAGLIPRLRPAKRGEAFDALVRLAPDATQHLLPLLDAPDTDVATGAAAALGRIGGETAREALLERVGKGDATRRRIVAGGLAALRTDEDLQAVLQATASCAPGPRLADLVLVAGRMARRGDAARAAAARIAALWPSKDRFELRYRVIAALGRLDPSGQLDLLTKAARLKDPVLRWLAAEQIRRVASERATGLLLGLLDDADPRGRATAALALGQRPRRRALGMALARRLGRERWTPVARSLAESLGRQCLAEGLAALRKRLVTGPRGVDIRALISITSCAPPGLDRELIGMAARATWRTPLRQRALELLTPPMARKNAGRLVKLLLELRRGAARSEDDEALAISAAKVLADSKTASAGEALADALALDPHESIRAAAAAGLGRLCHKQTREVLRRAQKDASNVVRGAARRAGRRCGF